MNRSETIEALASALCLAQAEVAGAKKDSENPHFRSKYADLASIWEACRGPLTKHGLSVIQSPRLVGGGENTWLVEVETTLLHKSGQFMADVIAIPVTRPDAQGVGSALTYARRYSLSAIVGVAPEDDDAEGAVARTSSESGVSKPLPPKRPPELGRITVKVLGIVQRQTSTGKTKYVISADDRQNYATFKEEIATDAKRAQEAGQAVEIAYKTSDYGRDIVTLVEAAVAEQVPL